MHDHDLAWRLTPDPARSGYAHCRIVAMRREDESIRNLSPDSLNPCPATGLQITAQANLTGETAGEWYAIRWGFDGDGDTIILPELARMLATARRIDRALTRIARTAGPPATLGALALRIGGAVGIGALAVPIGGEPGAMYSDRAWAFHEAPGYAGIIDAALERRIRGERGAA